jgi:hypothetical protein
MRTTFFLQTAYLSASLRVPPCFLELDTFYEPIVPDTLTGWRNFHLRYAENIFRRMGDIDRIRMVADPNARIERIIDTPREVLWLEPLQLHEAWRPHLGSFCGALCSEIKGSLQP